MKINQFMSHLTEEINEELQTIDTNGKDILQQVVKAINILENGYNRLKEFVSTYAFRNESEEISFFKEEKPKFFSRLLYYHKIHGIMMRRPAGSNEIQKEYLLKHFNRVFDFFDRNLEFYEYYRSSNTHLDNYYFLRGKSDICLNFDSYCYELDPKSSSCFDFKVAKILANDMLSVYLNTEIRKLDEHFESGRVTFDFPKVRHTWTGSKTDLVEIIYGIYVKGSLDNGSLDIKEYADYFSNVFNIELKDIYRIYLNIRNRKDSRTSYLDSMRDNLNQKMDDDDSR